jgi:hypothetical protein
MDNSRLIGHPAVASPGTGKGVSIVLSHTDLGTLKLAMLRQLDATLRQNYHQSLREVLNELRMRSIVAQPDPTPEKVFSVILQTHLLPYESVPAASRLRDALQRMLRGKYGLCIRCGKEIPVEVLLTDPAQAFCTLCHPTANG